MMLVIDRLLGGLSMTKYYNYTGILMSFLSSMYRKSKSNNDNDTISNKNPNRVSGGLRAQGVDHVNIVSEDGTERSIATKKYVDSLESKINSQHKRISILEKSLQKMSRTQQRLSVTSTERN